MLTAVNTNAPPGAPNAEARYHCHGSGFSTDQKEQANHSEQQDRFQVLSDRKTAFERLQRGFDAKGWNLHYLDGESCLAVERKWQLHSVCPDLRAAGALLRRIGGVA